MLEDLYAPGATVNAMARIDKARRPDILFLSARLGLGRHDSWAEPYDERLTKDKARAWAVNAAMREQFANTLRRFRGGAVLVAAGGDYRQVFAAWVDALAGDPRLDEIAVGWANPQVGYMRGTVKAFASGDVSMCIPHTVVAKDTIHGSGWTREVA